MTSPQPRTAEVVSGSRWRSPLAGRRFDTTVEVRPEEGIAIQELGVGNLRRLRRHDASAPGWRVIRRLLRPVDTVNAGLDSPPTPHRRRAMLDVVAVLLVRSADLGRAFWGWTTEEWVSLLGRDQPEFCRHAPAWAGDEVRPYLAAHAYLLGSFNEFHVMGGFHRLRLSWRIFGQDRVNAEITRIRAVLAQWGYQLGREDDTLLPNVICQLFLFNRSPHLKTGREGLRTRPGERDQRIGRGSGEVLACLWLHRIRVRLRSCADRRGAFRT